MYLTETLSSTLKEPLSSGSISSGGSSLILATLSLESPATSATLLTVIVLVPLAVGAMLLVEVVSLAVGAAGGPPMLITFVIVVVACRFDGTKVSASLGLVGYNLREHGYKATNFQPFCLNRCFPYRLLGSACAASAADGDHSGLDFLLY